MSTLETSARAGERCEFYRCSGWITLGHGNIGLGDMETLVLLVHWTVEINIKEMYCNWLDVYQWRFFLCVKGMASWLVILHYEGQERKEAHNTN